MNKWLSLGVYAFLSLIAINILTGIFFNGFFLGVLIFFLIKVLYFLMVVGFTVGILVAIKNFVFN